MDKKQRMCEPFLVPRYHLTLRQTISLKRSTKNISTSYTGHGEMAVDLSLSFQLKPNMLASTYTGLGEVAVELFLQLHLLLPTSRSSGPHIEVQVEDVTVSVFSIKGIQRFHCSDSVLRLGEQTQQLSEQTPEFHYIPKHTNILVHKSKCKEDHTDECKYKSTCVKSYVHIHTCTRKV